MAQAIDLCKKVLKGLVRRSLAAVDSDFSMMTALFRVLLRHFKVRWIVQESRKDKMSNIRRLRKIFAVDGEKFRSAPKVGQFCEDQICEFASVAGTGHNETSGPNSS